MVKTQDNTTDIIEEEFTLSVEDQCRIDNLTVMKEFDKDTNVHDYDEDDLTIAHLIAKDTGLC